MINSAGWSEEALKTWADAQQRYWNDRVARQKNESATPDSPDPVEPPAAPDWVQSFEQWWQSATTQSPPQLQDVLQRVRDMGRVYVGLGENVYARVKAKPDASALEHWLQSLEKGFAGWQQQMGQGHSASGSFGLGAGLLEGWQQFAHGLPGMELFRDVNVGGEHLADAGLWREHLNKMLVTPFADLGQEAQDHLTKLSQLAVNYQTALDAYLKAFAGQGTESVQGLRDRIQQLEQGGQKISSLRELYDLWVDVSEATYAQFALSERYQQVYADMVNAFFALKQGSNRFFDWQCRTAGLPARDELNAILQKQQQMRRENRQLRRNLQTVERRLASIERSLLSKTVTAVKTGQGEQA